MTLGTGCGWSKDLQTCEQSRMYTSEEKVSTKACGHNFQLYHCYLMEEQFWGMESTKLMSFSKTISSDLPAIGRQEYTWRETLTGKAMLRGGSAHVPQIHLQVIRGIEKRLASTWELIKGVGRVQEAVLRRIGIQVGIRWDRHGV